MRLRKADLLVLMTVVIWGVVFSVIKGALQEFDPLAFTSLRFLASSALLVLLALMWERGLLVQRGDWLKVALVGLTGVGLYQIFFIKGLEHTTASNSSLLIATAPLFTALFGVIAGQERLSVRQWLGIFLAFVGVALFIQAQGHDFSFNWDQLQGDILTLLAAMSAAASVLFSKDVLKRYSSLRVMALGVTMATVLILLFGAGAMLAQDFSRISSEAWLALGYSAVFASVFAYIAWFKGVADLGPTKLMLYAYLIPLVGVLTAVLTLKEPFTLLHWAGAATVFLGIGLVRWPGAPEREAISQQC